MVDGKVLAARFAGAADFETRKVISGGNELEIFFLDGLTSGRDIADFIVRPLHEARQDEREETLFTRAERGLVWCASMKKASSTDEAAELLVNGFCVILLSEKRKGAWVRGEDGGEALAVCPGGGEHRQGRKGRVYGDASHKHEPDPPPSAHAGAAAGGVGGGQAVADEDHGLLGGGPYRPGASRADEKAAGGDRH